MSLRECVSYVPGTACFVPWAWEANQTWYCVGSVFDSACALFNGTQTLSWAAAKGGACCRYVFTQDGAPSVYCGVFVEDVAGYQVALVLGLSLLALLLCVSLLCLVIQLFKRNWIESVGQGAVVASAALAIACYCIAMITGPNPLIYPFLTYKLVSPIMYTAPVLGMWSRFFFGISYCLLCLVWVRIRSIAYQPGKHLVLTVVLLLIPLFGLVCTSIVSNVLYWLNDQGQVSISDPSIPQSIALIIVAVVYPGYALINGGITIYDLKKLELTQLTEARKRTLKHLALQICLCGITGIVGMITSAIGIAVGYRGSIEVKVWVNYFYILVIVTIIVQGPIVWFFRPRFKNGLFSKPATIVRPDAPTSSPTAPDPSETPLGEEVVPTKESMATEVDSDFHESGALEL